MYSIRSFNSFFSVKRVFKALHSVRSVRSVRTRSTVAATRLHDDRFQPSGAASDLCLDGVQKAVKRALASNAEPEGRLADVTR